MYLQACPKHPEMQSGMHRNFESVDPVSDRWRLGERCSGKYPYILICKLKCLNILAIWVFGGAVFGPLQKVMVNGWGSYSSNGWRMSVSLPPDKGCSRRGGRSSAWSTCSGPGFQFIFHLNSSKTQSICDSNDNCHHTIIVIWSHSH